MSAEQKDATNKAVLALTQLKSATAIGINFDDFSSRLINAQATVETSLTSLPSGTLHDAIARTLQTYVASLGTWRDIQTLKDLTDQKVQMQRDFEDDTPRTVHERLELKFAREREDQESQKKAFQPLYDKWNEAGKQLSAVAALLAPKK